jgi:hypothetical protein
VSCATISSAGGFRWEQTRSKTRTRTDGIWKVLRCSAGAKPYLTNSSAAHWYGGTAVRPYGGPDDARIRGRPDCCRLGLQVDLCGGGGLDEERGPPRRFPPHTTILVTLAFFALRLLILVQDGRMPLDLTACLPAYFVQRGKGPGPHLFKGGPVSDTALLPSLLQLNEQE